MPITLQPITRREFVIGPMATLAGTIIAPELFGAPAPADPHRFALLADTHIHADRAKVYKNTNMAGNLERVIEELAALDPLPGSAFVLGDLAYRTGEEGDYATFISLLGSLQAA